MTQHDGGPVLLRVDRRGAHGNVVTISIDNQARLNSLSSGVIAAFIAAVRGVAEDPDLRCLIITGEGERSFMGGANLLELETFTPATSRAFLTQIHTMCQVLRDLPLLGLLTLSYITARNPRIDLGYSVRSGYAYWPLRSARIKA